MVIGYVGAAATKSLMIGLLILITARFFVPYEIAHPGWMLFFLVMTAFSFSLFGFLIGLWADDFQKLQVIPLMVMTPLTFLGGAFYSISMLPPFWQTVSLFNPVVYLISGMRWAFYGVSDVGVACSAEGILLFFALCLTAVWWMLGSGRRLRSWRQTMAAGRLRCALAHRVRPEIAKHVTRASKPAPPARGTRRSSRPYLSAAPRPRPPHPGWRRSRARPG